MQGDVIMSESNRNVAPAAIAQLEAQGQLQGQAELQGQLQGQAELQGQLQGQAQGQDQGQDQDQDQDQSQTSINGAVNYASNEVDSSSTNGNLNGNANGNLNGNANLNFNENAIDNDLDNGVTNSVDNDIDNDITTSVNTTVDVSVSGDFGPPTETSVLHMDDLGIETLDGNFLNLPDLSTQTLNGDGNIFNLDQVNSLVDADVLNGASVSLNAGAGGSRDFGLFTDGGGSDPGGPSFSFTQNGSAYGGTANNTSELGEYGTATGTANGSGTLTQEAFTQHIVMGANIQYNTMPISVVGGDSMSDSAPAE
ncbi:hypothetical protein C0214_02130 [Methylobacterium sp. DM1]|nr:hypothetical protein C0214_02130 [Methylobacterium sp. DM1]